MREKLKKRREAFGYTQKSFAKALKVNIRTVQNMEQGICFPRKHVLDKVMKLLDCSNFELWEDAQTPKRGDVTRRVAEYMTNLSNKTYSTYTVSIIRQALVEELKDRKKNTLKIKSCSTEGKKEIYERAAKIAKKKYNTVIYAEDIILYKKCFRQEYEDRTGKCIWGIPEVQEKLGFKPNKKKVG